MCRLAIYIGPQIVLSEFITDPDHSIIKQAVKAQEYIVQLNGDGFGISWYVPSLTKRPGVFKEISPAWNSHNLLELAAVTQSTCVMAHVRKASEASTIEQSNCHPFVHRKFSFMHNGGVANFKIVKRELVNMMSEKSYSTISGTTDSEHLFALWLDLYWKYKAEEKAKNPQPFKKGHKDAKTKDHKRELQGRIMARALNALIHTVSMVTAKHRPYHKDSQPLPKLDKEGQPEGGDKDKDYDNWDDGSTNALNIVITNGIVVVASRFHSGNPSESHTLYYCRGYEYSVKDGKSHINYTRNDPEDQSERDPSKELVIISSEPLTSKHKDDFVAVLQNHILVAHCEDKLDFVPVSFDDLSNFAANAD